MQTKLGLWQFLGASALVVGSAACGGSSSDNTDAAGAGGTSAAGSSAKGGSAGTTAAGKGGSAGVGTGGSAGTTGGTNATGGKGGATGGSAGKAGSAGTGTGGTTGGSAGKAGSAGSGTGGATGGTTGGTAGKAGSGQGGSAGSGQGGTAGKAGAGQGGTGGVGTGGVGAGGVGTGGVGAGGVGAGGVGTGGSTSTCLGGVPVCPITGLCPGPLGCTQGTGGSAGSAGGPPVTCASTDPTVDADGDGYFPPQDCNDCDPNTNPGAIDILNTDKNGNPLPSDQQIAENCGAKPLQVGDKVSCDDALQLADPDPIHGANAADLCVVAGGTKAPGAPGADYTYGIISAKYQQMDGAALPAGTEVGFGIQAKWGDVVVPKLGSNMLVLSSGTARLPGQPGFVDPGGADKGYGTGNPPGVPFDSPSCPGAQAMNLHDSVSLHLKLRAPTNAKSYSFQFRFTTYEFPQFVCSTYNDVFLARMLPAPAGAQPVNTNNISFDSMGNPVSINNGFFDVCAPNSMAGGKLFPCAAGPGDLAGTGYEMHAATSWLQTNAPVTPGQEFDLDWGVSDASDGVLASTVIIDDFVWSANPGTVQTGNACLLGGGGTCPACINTASVAPGCCAKDYAACEAEGPSGCQGILNCIGICKGVQSCEDGCVAGFPPGQAEYTKLLTCYYGDNTAANKGACGVACGIAAPLGRFSFRDRGDRLLSGGRSFSFVRKSSRRWTIREHTMRTVLIPAVTLVSTLVACGGDAFNDACPVGTDVIDHQCVRTVNGGAAGAAGSAQGTGGKGGVGGAGGQAAGSAGKGGAEGPAGAGGGAVAAAGSSGSGGAAGNVGVGGSGGTGGGKAGSAGASGGSAGGSAGNAGKAGGGAAGAGGGGAGASGGIGGAAGGAGMGGVAGTSGGVAGASGGSGGASGTAGAAGAGGSANVCEPNVSTCIDDVTLSTCDPLGQSASPTTCSSPNPFCVGTACVACTDTMTQCSNKVRQTCAPDGSWMDADTCDIDCAAGACVTVKQLSTSLTHTCALLSDGTIRCWGDNSYGVLGATPAEDGQVVKVASVSTAVAVGTSIYASCAALGDGSVVCWGNNLANQLGQDAATLPGSLTPVPVPGISTAINVAMSGDASSACATLSDHTLVCWGGNVVPPAPISGVSNVTKVALGEGFACARQVNNKVFCWGNNNLGQCGTGATTPQTISTPTEVNVGAGAYDIVAGRSHACVSTPSTAVICWGDDLQGQLGPGATTPGPYFVPNVHVSIIGRGRYHTCGREANGDVTCWGTVQGKFGPTIQPGVAGPILLAGGNDFDCALTAPTVVTCWGNNFYGTLGQGDTIAYSTPVPVKW